MFRGNYSLMEKHRLIEILIVISPISPASSIEIIFSRPRSVCVCVSVCLSQRWLNIIIFGIKLFMYTYVLKSIARNHSFNHVCSIFSPFIPQTTSFFSNWAKYKYADSFTYINNKCIKQMGYNNWAVFIFKHSVCKVHHVNEVMMNVMHDSGYEMRRLWLIFLLLLLECVEHDPPEFYLLEQKKRREKELNRDYCANYALKHTYGLHRITLTFYVIYLCIYMGLSDCHCIWLTVALACKSIWNVSIMTVGFWSLTLQTQHSFERCKGLRSKVVGKFVETSLKHTDRIDPNRMFVCWLGKREESCRIKERSIKNGKRRAQQIHWICNACFRGK